MTACPDNLTGAAGDASWVADRIASIADEKITTGQLYDVDGAQHEFVSAKDADSDRALKVGRDVGVFPLGGRPFVVDHVEVKVAAAMRDAGEKSGVLVINNRKGPCQRDDEGDVEPMSCLAYLPKLLPAGRR